MGKGKLSSNMTYQGDMLIPWRVSSWISLGSTTPTAGMQSTTPSTKVPLVDPHGWLPATKVAKFQYGPVHPQLSWNHSRCRLNVPCHRRSKAPFSSAAKVGPQKNRWNFSRVLSVIWLVVEFPTHLKKYAQVKLDDFARDLTYNW